MSLLNPLGYLFWPKRQWQQLAECDAKHFSSNPWYPLYPLILALLPAIAWFYGASVTGWAIDDGDTIRLTTTSTLKIIPLFYLAMVSSILLLGYMTHWMAETYEANSSPAKGISLVAFAATPLLLAGGVGFFPHMLLDMTVGLLALSWSLYLLYTGIPVAMGLSPERGFLYASAIVAVGLVIFVGVLVVTVILWDMGAAPQFTD